MASDYKCQHCQQEFQDQDELQRHNSQQHREQTGGSQPQIMPD